MSLSCWVFKVVDVVNTVVVCELCDDFQPKSNTEKSFVVARMMHVVARQCK